MKNSSKLMWTISGLLSISAAQFLNVVVLTKLGNTHSVGLYFFGLAVVVPVVLLSNMKLRQVIATDHNCENTYREYVAAKSFTCLICVVVFYIGLQNFGGDGVHSEKFTVISAIFLSKMAETYIELNYGYFQKSGKQKKIAILQMFLSLCQVFVFFFVYRSTNDLGYTCWAVFFVNLIFVIVAFLSYKAFNTKYEEGLHQETRTDHGSVISEVKIIIYKSFPLGLATAVASLQANIPRIIIEKEYSTSQLGVYSSVVSLVLLGSVLLSGISQANMSKLSKYFSDNNYLEFEKLFSKMQIMGFFVGCALCLMATLFGRELLGTIFSPEYKNYSYLLVLISISFLVRSYSIFYGTAIAAMRVFNLHYKIISIVIIANITSIYIFISMGFGLAGVGYASISTAIVEFFIYRHFFKTLLDSGSNRYVI